MKTSDEYAELYGGFTQDDLRPIIKDTIQRRDNEVFKETIQCEKMLLSILNDYEQCPKIHKEWIELVRSIENVRDQLGAINKNLGEETKMKTETEIMADDIKNKIDQIKDKPELLKKLNEHFPGTVAYVGTVRFKSMQDVWWYIQGLVENHEN